MTATSSPRAGTNSGPGSGRFSRLATGPEWPCRPGPTIFCWICPSVPDFGEFFPYRPHPGLERARRLSVSDSPGRQGFFPGGLIDGTGRPQGSAPVWSYDSMIVSSCCWQVTRLRNRRSNVLNCDGAPEGGPVWVRLPVPALVPTSEINA